MADVSFSYVIKMTAANAEDYAIVQARLQLFDPTSLGRSITMTTNPDDDPLNFVISVTITGVNDPPA